MTMFLCTQPLVTTKQLWAAVKLFSLKRTSRGSGASSTRSRRRDAGLVERPAGLVHELGRAQRVRRVARDAGRQRERVADRADASSVPRTRSAAHTAPASGVSSRIAPTIRSPSRHAASLSRNVRRTTSPTTPSAC